MREELQSHKIVFSLIAMWLVIFLITGFYLGLYHSAERLEAELLLIVSIAITSALGYVGLAEIIVGVQFGAAHRRELLTYLLLGTLSLLSGLMLAIATEISLPRLALAVSPYAILFGAFQLRLGQGLSRHPVQRRSFRVCGAIEIASGVVLACASFFSGVNVIRLLAVTAASTLLQLLPFLFFSRRNA
ncbi:MAG TPA: hypothetical protein VGE93_13015 [Bryobacteraceae bacterium]|nr:hypothetical protein [Acidobacteriaceae bacterium]